MTDLNETRARIDAIDTQMIDLLLQRMECAEKVAAYKAERNLPIMDRTRERKIIADAAARVDDDMKSYVETMMSLLMEASRSRQRSLLGMHSKAGSQMRAAIQESPLLFPPNAYVATQGAEGAFQQIAADRFFRHASIHYLSTFEAVFRAVEEGFCNFGVLPLENSTAGSVNQVFDLMMRHDFHIVRTCRVKIDHNLLAKPGCNREQITDVYSHEQALSQCEGYLASLGDITIHACQNTALASKLVAEDPRPGVAALASRDCAELYGLDILERSVQDQDNNYTRFACIAKSLTVYPGADRSSFMLVVNHKPGALYRVLGKFHALGINVIKLESRPIPERDFEFMFYFDVQCPVVAPEFMALIDSLDDVCEEWRYLGSYSEVV